jgi:hypothetical protein
MYEVRLGAYRVLVWKPEGKNHLEDPGVDGTIILRWNFTKCDGGMDWIDMAQDSDGWWAPLNAVINHLVP